MTSFTRAWHGRAYVEGLAASKAGSSFLFLADLRRTPVRTAFGTLGAGRCVESRSQTPNPALALAAACYDVEVIIFDMVTSMTVVVICCDDLYSRLRHQHAYLDGACTSRPLARCNLAQEQTARHSTAAVHLCANNVKS